MFESIAFCLESLFRMVANRFSSEEGSRFASRSAILRQKLFSKKLPAFWRPPKRSNVSILGVEVNHFAIWHDKAGNAVSKPLAGVTDPETSVTFPDLKASSGELFQTNLIMPEPCEFIKANLPACAVIRPSLKENAGAVATAMAVAKSQLFLGQSQAFFDAVIGLAMAADAAQRKHGDD